MASAAKTIASECLVPPWVPRWLKGDGVPTTLEDAALRAGAALSILDACVWAEQRRETALVPVPLPVGAWRHRLALKAAAASARMLRRGEDEAALRDAFYYRHGSDDPGPGGRLVVAWRALDRGLDRSRDRASGLDEDTVLHVAETLNLKVDDALRSAIAGARQLAASDRGAPLAAAETARLVVAHRCDAETLALWLADAVLATRLKWPVPPVLIAPALLDRSLRAAGGRRPHPGDPTWVLMCTAAYARAAVEACELFAALSFDGQKLVAVTTRLRAKGAGAVIDKLLNDDAVLPTGRLGVMSDRGLRRLFDRLVSLGAVRELTGRPTFRLYGL